MGRVSPAAETFVEDGPAEGIAPARDFALVVLALVASAVLLWLVSGQLLLGAAFLAATVALGTIAFVLVRRPPAEQAPVFASPDWSVTYAAIEREDMAVAITDRAGRLVCANSRFTDWFGAKAAPPRLPLDAGSSAALEDAGRCAWRDGQGRVEALASATGRWTAGVERAGRGDDYLVWRFTPLVTGDLVADMAAHVAGKLGRALAREGVQAALVNPEGVVIAANPAFAARAAGDGAASVAGSDFVSFLRSDEQERIYYAREGRKGVPVRLVHIPVADPDGTADTDPSRTPSLFLLLDNQGGMGDVRAGLPQIEALLARLPLGLAMTDRDGRFLFANEAFLRAAGHDDTVPPPYPSDLVIREDKSALADAVRLHAQGATTAGDVAVRLRTSPEEPISLSLAGVRGLGEAVVLLGLTDSTEETRLKRQVAQATKMQAVGQLAGGVAHDFNNVLTAILGTCDLMLLRHTPGDSDYDDIQQIRANSNRAASLTRQLLAFSRQQTLRPEVLQLPDVVADIGQMLKRLVGEKIQFTISHDRDLGPVRADPTQLEQVIVNLVVNARDAMAGKLDGHAKLTLSTRRVTSDAVRAMRSEIIPQGDYTALVVEDTGSGIAPEHLGKIFEPFFTTKEQGRGTGLGLSTVYGIVKQSGGFIFADSEPGRGTKFTVYFPVHYGEPSATVEIKAEPRTAWAGGGRVMLVEDEDTVRAVAERALTRAGYTVTTASDGEEGLELVQAGGEFDLVVSDVVMPVMDGPAMAKAIRKLHPEMPVLFMSGYAEEQLRKEIHLEGVHFLPKPFSVQQISDKVGGVLSGG